MNSRNTSACLLRREEGITLSEIPTFKGSRKVIGAPVRAFVRPRKSPVRTAAGGTNCSELTAPCASRPASQLKKKNVLSVPRYSLGIKTGPAMFAPNWFRFNRGGVTLLPAIASYAWVRASFRLNSQSVPVQRLPPRFVIMLICPPGAPPDSADELPVSTLNSASESTEGENE